MWTPDGKALYFTSLRGGQYHVLLKSADGTGEETPVLKDRFRIRVQSVSSDGQTLLLGRENPSSLSDLLLYRPAEDKLEVLLQTPFSERTPRFSPDDGWIAYTSDGVPRMEVWVMPSTPGAAPVQVTTNGGEEPNWSADGRELFYRDNDQWMAVEIITEPELKGGGTRQVFTGSYLNVPGYSYDYDPVRKRFLVIEPSEEPPEIRVITNWFDRLK